jgi:hypothetical protein
MIERGNKGGGMSSDDGGTMQPVIVDVSVGGAQNNKE